MTGDTRFLIYAIPGLILLIVLPMTLGWMSRRSYAKAEGEYDQKARNYKIGQIGESTRGRAVRIRGKVEKIRFRWLNRPHFQVKDDTGTIRVILFTSPAERVSTGDRVEVLGMVMKNIFDRRSQAVSAVSIKKIGS
ncbi:MAG: nucleotide-binding protein [Deltaproteobacteria bacterium]|nr:nucleotide-binding protein [Deltaproteobacteria bacterium]